ncbi:MAG: DUF1801 domain-containing protein [Chitinophagaceae bacterium]|nr:MAG: DUF1801 domain-containing protein [Chitinophagaceae bacterium]
MNAVENFIIDYEGQQKDILFYLHDLLIKIPGIEPKVRYGIPFYYRKSWICYLNPDKKGNVEFAFLRGNELENKSGLLQSKGRKQVMGITYSKVEEIKYEAVIEIIEEALKLDENVPYASKRKPKE